MLLALGAVSTALNAVQSLTSSAASSASSTGFDQDSANPFELASPAPTSASSVPATGFRASAQISPATMSELLAAQSSGNTGPGSDPLQQALQAGSTAPASSSYQSLGQLFQREAQAISFSVAPLSFNA
ncbi:MAG TPA: hypothetical protein VGM00_08750 [Bradyrhizobium sp.]|jgi:hypothetical protein